MTAEGVPAIGRLPNDIWREPSFTQRFQVLGELGIGGQAVVVAAYHRELDERVALKFLLPEVAQSAAAVARFRREARAAAKIKSEHVVRIFDVCSTESGLPYIVMEHLQGHDLEHCLQEAENHRLEIGAALDFILQASEALAEGHRLGIVHRDLKPANLFCVDRDDGFPMIKVLDFGISKIKPLAGDVERTDRYEILGSPRYMSPEQIDASRDVDLRSDIWSLGVILYEALAGRAPFESDIVAELWHKVRTETPRPLTDLRENLPPALNRIVMKTLEKERSRRYPNLGELAGALYFIAPERCRRSIERIRHVSGMPPAPYSSSPAVVADRTLHAIPPSRRSRQSRSMLIGVGIGATALAGFAATRFAPTHSPERPAERPTSSATLSARPAVVTTHEPKEMAEVAQTNRDRVKLLDSDVAPPPKRPRPPGDKNAVARGGSGPVSAVTSSSSPHVSVVNSSSPQGHNGHPPEAITIMNQPSTSVAVPSSSSTIPWIASPVNRRKRVP